MCYSFGVFVVGNRQHALTILGHDAAHYSISKVKWINDLIGNLTTFWPLGADIRAYRPVHFKHHRTVGTPNDPELEHKNKRASQWSLPKSKLQLLLLTLKDMAGFGALDLWIVTRVFGPKRWQEFIGPLVTMAIVHGALFYFGLWWMSTIWFVSLFTSFWACFRWRAITEHHGVVGTHRIHLGPMLSFLIAPHNTWYHYEHHRWPYVPFWSLPTLRKHHKDKAIISFADLLTLLDREE